MIIQEIQSNEYDHYYGRYIKMLSQNLGLIEGFESGASTLLHFIHHLPSEKLNFRYAKGKWSIKEVLQHLIDTERIFIYRCFRIARHDQTSLAGFDQNIYIDPAKASQKSLKVLSKEYECVRAASISLLGSLSDDDLKCIGHANQTPMSARAAAAVIIGHEIWHMEIIKKRYL